MHLLEGTQHSQLRTQVIFLEPGPFPAEISARIDSKYISIETLHSHRTSNIMAFVRSIAKIRSLVYRHGSQLVVGWMTKAHVYGGLAGLSCAVPTVWFQHGWPERGGLDRVARLVPTKRIFVASRLVGDEQRRVSPSARVSVLPVGVDTSRFDIQRLPTIGEARRMLGLPNEGPIIGIVARLQKWKGVHSVIKAVPELVRSHPKLTCVIVGGAHDHEPDYQGYLSELVNSLKLQSSVRFVGARRDIPIWMQSMDVVVHASNREPFGIVVLEAMALGKKVVVCEPSGVTEVMPASPGVRKFTFDDVASLSSCLLELLSIESSVFVEHVEFSRAYSHDRFASRLIQSLLSECRRTDDESFLS